MTSRGRPVNRYCKYGHLKAGHNLLLRPRSIKVKANGRTYYYRNDYIERVCVTCLNRQKREYAERRAMKSKGRVELAIRRQIAHELHKEVEHENQS